MTRNRERTGPQQSSETTFTQFDVGIAEAQRLYTAGKSSEALNLINPEIEGADPRSRLEFELLIGMAKFDQGHVTEALKLLARVETESRKFDLGLQFRSALALFNRSSEFLTPMSSLPLLTRLRQVTAARADVRSLGGLHLAVAKLEACRGNYLAARTHVETARGFVEQASSKELKCALNLVDGSLEVLGGNISRARSAAQEGHADATITGNRIHLAGCAALLGLTSLLMGDSGHAERYLNHALPLSGDVLYMRLAILDNLAQVALWNDDLDACDRYLKLCAHELERQTAPARSWYDLAHQVTRCAVLSHVGEWEGILEITSQCEPEADRRQFRTLRTSFLCASARANASLGHHKRAEAQLAAAVRVCPKGAIEALVILEGAIAHAAALRSDLTGAQSHFDRAISTARAIGNRVIERQVELDCAQTQRRVKTSGVSDSASLPDTRSRSLVVTDAARVLGAGGAVALLTQSAVSIVRGTPLADQMRVSTSSGEELSPETTVSSTIGADNSMRVEIRGSDRCDTLFFKRLESLDDVMLAKSVVELLQAAVKRRSDGDDQVDDVSLWPNEPVDLQKDAVFSSERMIEIVRVALRLATSVIPILITGETGTGKEVLAKLVHANSASKRGPFIPFNCSAIPKDLIESQLFGHKKGAFTGASEHAQGVIRAAAGGTLFLDEIGDLEPSLQPRLLRFIESGEILVVGEDRPTTVKVRIVAATNSDLNEESKAGRFRKDLYFRLGAAQICLPPLRERKDEIPALTAAFVSRFSREAARPRLRVSDDLIAALLLYDWPGNIRQLANELQRIVAMAEPGQTLTSKDLSPAITEGWTLTQTPVPEPAAAVRINVDQTLPQAIEELEREFVSRAMRASGGRVAEAAQLLGISRKGLFLKRRRWGHLDPEPADLDG